MMNYLWIKTFFNLDLEINPTPFWYVLDRHIYCPIIMNPSTMKLLPVLYTVYFWNPFPQKCSLIPKDGARDPSSELTQLT